MATATDAIRLRSGGRWTPTAPHLLDELARAAGVSVNALAVAALHAGVPAAHEDARAALLVPSTPGTSERATAA